MSPHTSSLIFPSTKLYPFLIFVAFPISYLFPHIFSQEKRTYFPRVSDFLNLMYLALKTLFSACMHLAGKSEEPNDYQERRRDKQPPAPSLCRRIPSSAQPCPADCRVTLQERGTRCCSAGKTCSAVCSGRTPLPPTTP